MQPWLTKLSRAQLSRVAFLLGAPMSGTKPVLVHQIQQVLHEASLDGAGALDRSGDGTTPAQPRPLSVVSIDMGIRNLAYAHLTARLLPFPDGGNSSSNNNNNNNPPSPPPPTLLEWRRVAISSASDGNSHYEAGRATRPSKPEEIPNDNKHDGEGPRLTTTTATTTTTTTTTLSTHADANRAEESFDAASLARGAHTLVSHLLSTCTPRPTHFLIERQRFRSGGAPAVQEWTLRVGVLEGMLHAVLRTMAAERGGAAWVVKSVDPGRVGRFWLDREDEEDEEDEEDDDDDEGGGGGGDGDGGDDAGPEKGTRDKKRKRKTRSGRETKRAKIEAVRRLLDGHGDDALLLLSPMVRDAHAADGQAHRTAAAFSARLNRHHRRPTSTTAGPAPPPPAEQKLDDLADCLLQGLAWLAWERRRAAVLRDGPAAFRDDPVIYP